MLHCLSLHYQILLPSGRSTVPKSLHALTSLWTSLQVPCSGAPIHSGHQHTANDNDDEDQQADQALPAEQLNADIAISEVQAAFTRLRRHKVAGINGIKAEHLLNAS